MGWQKANELMDYTVIRNTEATDDDAAQINWRRRMGKTQVRCPRCDEFFTVPKDVKFDKEGNADRTVYHICEDSEGDDDGGWVVALSLEGWEK